MNINCRLRFFQSHHLPLSGDFGNLPVLVAMGLGYVNDLVDQNFELAEGRLHRRPARRCGPARKL